MSARKKDTKAPCVRCGVPTFAEFCGDCKTVDPRMTAGARSARQMYWIRTEGERAHAELLRELTRIVAPSEARRRKRTSAA